MPLEIIKTIFEGSFEISVRINNTSFVTVICYVAFLASF